jgi:RND superfamily putative drug exporter
MNKRMRKPSKLVRILIPFLLVVIWFGVGGVGGPYFGRINEVTSNDQVTFLPASAESTKASKELKDFQENDAIPAIVTFDNGGKDITREQIGSITRLGQKLQTIDAVAGNVSPPIVAKDNKAALVVLNMKNGADYKDFSKEIRSTIDGQKIRINYHISGPVGFLSDLSKAFSGIDGILLGVALGVVFVILLVVYRSPILPIIVLINSMFALCAAILVVFYLAKAGVLAINGQVQGILFILVIGAATDYALLLVARYREELTRHQEAYQAIITSLKRSLEPILAASGTVIAGLLCLLLSDLNSNKALGPVGAVGIALAVVATLTLLPSLLVLFGRAVFWPFRPIYQSKKHSDVPKKGLWVLIGDFVSRRSRIIWAGSLILLIILSLGVAQLKANGVPQSEFVLGESSARDGQAVIDAHFAGGLGTPAQIIVPTAQREAAVNIITNAPGVESAAYLASGSPTGALPADKELSALPMYLEAKPKVVNDRVVVQATLANAADSLDAESTIVALRDKLHRLDAAIIVGGPSATQLDTRTSSERDREVVIPAVLIVITIILMVLLRSVVAPIVLLLTTILSFAATLGIAALLFNNVFKMPGADPSVVLYAFVFLVALGIDYNIFLMTRVREESLKLGTRKGVIVGLIVTGGVITSAGVVLAATFAALAVIPILFLLQLAFIVAFGVLLDTTLVRSLFVPSIIYELNKKAWWPARLR